MKGVWALFQMISVHLAASASDSAHLNLLGATDVHLDLALSSHLTTSRGLDEERVRYLFIIFICDESGYFAI